jgi:rhomboid family GlyGly-CTERM serine protease
MSGEFWRLATHPLVHFSDSHLLVDLVVFLALLVAGRSMLDRMSPFALLFIAMSSGIGSLLLDSELLRLGGLSAVNTGLAVLIGVRLMEAGDRSMSGLLLAATALKLGVEAAGADGLTRYDSPDVQTCAVSHGLGAMAGIVWHWGSHLNRISLRSLGALRG